MISTSALVGVGALEVGPDRRGVVADLGVPDVCRSGRGRAPATGRRVQSSRTCSRRGAGRRPRRGCRPRRSCGRRGRRHRGACAAPSSMGRTTQSPTISSAKGLKSPKRALGTSTVQTVPAVGALPAGDALGALDDDVLALRRLVGDPACVAEAAAARGHPLAVLTRVDDHRSPGCASCAAWLIVRNGARATRPPGRSRWWRHGARWSRRCVLSKERVRARLYDRPVTVEDGDHDADTRGPDDSTGTRRRRGTAYGTGAWRRSGRPVTRSSSPATGRARAASRRRTGRRSSVSRRVRSCG